MSVLEVVSFRLYSGYDNRILKENFSTVFPYKYGQLTSALRSLCWRVHVTLLRPSAPLTLPHSILALFWITEKQTSMHTVN